MNQLNAKEQAPREIEELMKLPRGRRYLFGMHMGIFSGTEDEQAFLSSTDEEQCQRLRTELIQRDTTGWPEQGQPMPPVPVMPPQQPQPQPEEAPMQPPQFRPVIPATVAQQPQMQPQQPQQAPQMPMQMPMAMPPQMPMAMPAYQQQPQQQPQMPAYQQPQGMPQMPGFPPQQQPQQPQMQPPQWQQPQPPQMPVVAPQVLPSGRAPAVPSSPQPGGLGEVLTKIAEVQAANQKLLEAIHRHQVVNTALLTKVLGTLITTAEMQGLPRATLANAVASIGSEENVKEYIQASGGEPNQGKG